MIIGFSIIKLFDLKTTYTLIRDLEWRILVVVKVAKDRRSLLRRPVLELFPIPCWVYVVDLGDQGESGRVFGAKARKVQRVVVFFELRSS
jgi:hypothetical protein